MTTKDEPVKEVKAEEPAAKKKGGKKGKDVEKVKEVI